MNEVSRFPWLVALEKKSFWLVSKKGTWGMNLEHAAPNYLQLTMGLNWKNHDKKSPMQFMQFRWSKQRLFFPGKSAEVS